MASSRDKKLPESTARKKLTRLGSFSSKEVFHAWAKDSLLKPSTITKLTEEHEVDSLPAVLALRSRDISSLGLSVGQARLFEVAAAKLHAEYEYQEPPSPATRVDVEMPRYKSLLDGTKADEDQFPQTGSFFSYNNTDKGFGNDKTAEERLLPDRDDEDETQSGCACERWLFISIFMPVILVVSLLGLIAWLFLWPLNRFCALGKPFPTVFKTTERMMKAPLEGCSWAIGRRRVEDERNSGPPESIQNYGGTDTVQMKEMNRTN